MESENVYDSINAAYELLLHNLISTESRVEEGELYELKIEFKDAPSGVTIKRSWKDRDEYLKDYREF